jgi:hypothetical protein
MGGERQRTKARRRAAELCDDAWRAVEAGDLALAERLCRRAVAEDEENFEAWTDLGEVLLLQDKLAEADRAFRQALAHGPSSSEAWAGLAEIYVREDKLAKAVDHLRRAVASDRYNRVFVQRLQELEARLEPRRGPVVDETRWRAAPPPGPHALRIDWQQVARDVDARGCALLPDLLAAEENAALAALWSAPEVAARELRYDGPEAGRFARRGLGSPLPAAVAALCGELYSCLVPLACRRAERLDRQDRWPPAYEDLVALRERNGEAGTYAALCRLAAGDFCTPAREPAGGDFPFELVVALGTVLARLRQIGGVWGMQPVAHGLTCVASGERLVLDARL